MSLEALGNYDHLPQMPLGRGLSIIASAVFFFALLNYAVKRRTSSDFGAGDDTWKWRNLFISWIHAIIVGVWDLSCFYCYPELMTDLIAFNNLYIYSLVAFSTGYFLYDFIDIVASGKIGKMWEVIPHHVAVAGMFFYNIVESRCVAYNVVALLSEVNTIFLHSRKLLQMHNWSFDHWLYRLNSALNLLTFLGCRFFGITWIVYGMFVYWDRVSHVYYWVLGAAMFVMWVTNVLLFWRLLQSDVIRPWLKRSRSQRSGGRPGTSNCRYGGDDLPKIGRTARMMGRLKEEEEEVEGRDMNDLRHDHDSMPGRFNRVKQSSFNVSKDEKQGSCDPCRPLVNSGPLLTSSEGRGSNGHGWVNGGDKPLPSCNDPETESWVDVNSLASVARQRRVYATSIDKDFCKEREAPRLTNGGIGTEEQA